MISLFNKGELGAIICTSSMIEGVNTAAENVFVYDRHISISKLDRFTFDNIKGRAGRLFQHKIGKVYLYNPPPEASDFEVNIPLFEGEDRLVPELLVQIDDGALSSAARQRKRAISESSYLPLEVLAQWAEFGIDELNSLAESLQSELDDSGSSLYWKGIPDFDAIESTFNAAWGTIRFHKHEIRSARQLAHFANVLRRNYSVRGYLDELVQGTGSGAQTGIDTCFNFMRGCEYTFPQVLRALNDVIDAIIGQGVVDYRVYASQMQNLFIAGELRALDEYGVPIPLIQTMSDDLDTEDVQNARRSLENRDSPSRRRLSAFENRMLDLGLDLE